MKRLAAILTAAVLLVCLLPLGSVAVSAAATDLSVTDFSWNTATEVTPGTPVTFAVTVKNTGAAVTEPFVVTFGTAQSIFATVTYSGGLAAGASTTIKAQPWTAVKGDYMVAVRINATNTIDDANKENDTTQKNLRVGEGKLGSAFSTTQEMMEKGHLTSLIFSDDFDSLATVDTTDSGKEGFKWYVDRPYGAKTLTTDDYSVKDGVMTVHNVVPTYNYGLGTYHPDKKLGWAYNLGYMEVRVRVPRPRKNETGEKGVPAIWSLPPEKLTNRSSAWVEMDWLEYWGVDQSHLEGYYTVCLHEQHLTGSTVTTWYKNGGNSRSGLGDGDWHVLGWLWQEGLFVSYYDGVEVKRQTYSKDVYPDPMYSVQEGLPADGVFTMLDTQYNPIIIGGSQDNPMELDYVRVWGGNRTYNPEKITTRPMTAKEFVKLHLTDGDGNPLKTVTEENYGYILMSEYDWDALEEATKLEVDKLLKANGQPTYAALLAQAMKFENTTTTTKKPTTTTTTTTKPTAKPTGGGLVTLPPTSSTSDATASTFASLPTLTLPTGDGSVGTTAPTVTVPATTVKTKATEANTTPKDDPSSPVLLIVAIVAAVLLLGTAAALLLLKKKKPTE